jgi:hypothetical protein
VVHRRAAHGFGRRFESPRGLQGASRAVRRICSAKYYRDWDIENAFPVILHAKLEAAVIPCPVLSLYVRDREVCLSATMSALGVNHDVAKELWIMGLHGGNYKNHAGVPAGATHPPLDQFTAEIRVAVPKLAAVPEYTELHAIVQNDPAKDNKAGSFVALVCQVTEDKAIAAAEEYLEQQVAARVDVLVFDGVMTRIGRQDARIDPAAMSRHASDAIGLRVTVREKPFTLLPSDLQVLRPADVRRVLERSGLGADAQRELLDLIPGSGNLSGSGKPLPSSAARTRSG